MKIFLILIVFCVLTNSIFSQNTKDRQETEMQKESEGSITESKLIKISDNESKWKLSFYGFIKNDYVYANHAILSYGRENLVAPNQAKRQVQRDDYQARSNIQLGDSRLGFKSEFGPNLSGIIELDFIDFSQSSPNVNVRPRLRQAFFNWTISNKWDIFAGQKWDIFSPLNPDTYNIINNLFYLGNVGWIREQIGTAYKLENRLTASFALGNTKVNTSAAPDVSIERNLMPTIAAQLKWQPNQENTVFLSGITVGKSYYDPNSDPARSEGKSLQYNGDSDAYPLTGQYGKTNKIKRQASGISIGSEYKTQSGNFRLKWEGNWGRNLSDLNVLGIGQAQVTNAENRFLSSEIGFINGGNSFQDIQNYNKIRTEVVTIEENGGWLSCAYRFLPEWELGILLGTVRIVNRKDLSPAFDTSKSNPDAPFRDFSRAQADPVGGSWTPSFIGRIRENNTIGYNLTHFPMTGLKLFFQHEYIQTFYHNSSRNSGLAAHIKSVNVETGEVVLRNVKYDFELASAKASSHIIRIGAMYSF